MDIVYDYKKYYILYVDDEEKSLKNFVRAYEDQFRILTALSAREGLKVLEAHGDDLGLLMTDQRMPAENGVWLLERARQLRPGIIRILATAYSDMEAAIAAVNSGAIYKYVSKPWDPPQLETTLKRGLEFFMVQKERDLLLQEKMSVLHNMMIADRLVSLGLLATGLSHHIRNALQAVRTFVDLAPLKMEEEKMDVRSVRNPEFWKEYYHNVQLQITKINELLSELCDVSQTPGAPFREAVNLHSVIREVRAQIAPLFSAHGIQVENAVAPELPMMKVDKPKFYRLFELLLRDEIVTLPRGSIITISAHLTTDPAADKPEMEIVVQDNGPGLPKDALRLVFDPFVVRGDIPTEYGIHLMGCFFIVHHHGGRISASSEEGKGTIFNICLPLNPEKVQPASGGVDFFQKVIQNQKLWEKLVASDS